DVCLQFLCHHGVNRKHDLAAFRLRVSHNLARRGEKIVLAQRSTDIMTQCGQERVRHSAPNNEDVQIVRFPLCYDAQSAVERELVLRLASVLWRLRRAIRKSTKPRTARRVWWRYSHAVARHEV